ncbi:unnamed protein product, partial [Thlaspi arvense]
MMFGGNNRAQVFFKKHGWTDGGKIEAKYTFCPGRCRHNSESVFMILQTTSSFTIVFLWHQMLQANLTQVQTRLLGINVTVVRLGDSCDAVCKSCGRLCVMNKLSLLNQYMIAGSCLASARADQPAEVVDDAPRDLTVMIDALPLNIAEADEHS